MPLGKEDKVPYDVNSFHPYFKYTYYCVDQVLGKDDHPLMDIVAMVICVDLQSKDPKLFDFTTFLAEVINHGLEKLKEDVINVHFKYYSILMHMLLYVGQEKGLWPDELCIRAYDKARMKKLVQLWISSLDQRYSNNQYWHFEEFFVKTLYRLLGYPCDHALSPKIQIFLRPKEYGEDTSIEHNWGDWYCFLDYTQIRVYGFEGKPYLLPFMVPNRVVCLEIVRQLSTVSAQHLTDHRKKSIVLGLLVFSDFIVKSSKSYGLLHNKLNCYKMVEGDPRPKFDPEGYIREAKVSQKLGAGDHELFMPDDFIKNLDRETAIAKMIQHDKVSKAYARNLNRGKINDDVLQGIDDPLAKANKLMEHELEFLEGVPAYVFRDRAQPIRDTDPLIQMSPQSTSDFIPIDLPREDYPPSFESDVQLNLVTGQYNVQEIGDIRLLEHEDFIVDNDFISSKEFNTFLCQHKRMQIRDVMKGKIEEEKI